MRFFHHVCIQQSYVSCSRAIYKPTLRPFSHTPLVMMEWSDGSTSHADTSSVQFIFVFFSFYNVLKNICTVHSNVISCLLNHKEIFTLFFFSRLLKVIYLLAFPNSVGCQIAILRRLFKGYSNKKTTGTCDSR